MLAESRLQIMTPEIDYLQNCTDHLPTPGTLSFCVIACVGYSDSDTVLTGLFPPYRATLGSTLFRNSALSKR